MNPEPSTRIWRIFAFICLASLLFGVAVWQMQWRHEKRQADSDLRYANELVANSLRILLRKYEAMLGVLGERLLELDGLAGAAQAQSLVDRLLAENPELAGFGLADRAGNLVLTSSNIDPARLPNLREQTETTDTFLQALRSEHMVIGRTYFMPALSEWVIPLRFALRDSANRVVAVMTTGLRLGSANSLLSSATLPPQIKFVVVSRDLYRVFASHVTTGEYGRYYGRPVAPKTMAAFRREVREQTGHELEEVARLGQVVTLVAPNEEGEDHLIALRYEPRYAYYVLTATPLAVLHARHAVPAALMALLLLVFNGILFAVLRGNERLQREASARLVHQASHDELTGLPNRHYLIERFPAWRAAHARGFSVLFIDLDNFKSINDLHGHSIGDSILREVAIRLRLGFDAQWKIRHGGDEFIVFAPQVWDAVLERQCRRFLERLRAPIRCGGQEFSIRASIGVAQSPADGRELDELLRKADMAMYEAKRLHSDIHVYTTELESRAERIGRIERALDAALTRKEFHLVYQPQINAADGRLLGFETLLRWTHPELGQVRPDAFVPLAESLGMMGELGRFVVETALAELATLQGTEAFHVAVNVSPSQLDDERFVADLIRTHAECGNRCGGMVIEVTESLFIEDVDFARRVLADLRAQGMQISLDDFGTGYSSLSLLSKLPLSELKIDKGFVRDILSNPQDRQLIRSIIGLGKGLGIPVLAEGVETLEQARMLAGFGCDRFQGYFFAPPLPLAELAAFVASWEARGRDWLSPR